MHKYGQLFGCVYSDKYIKRSLGLYISELELISNQLTEWLFSVFFPYFYFSVFSQKVTQPHPPPSRPPCRCNRNNSAHYRLVSYHYSVSHFTLGFTDDCISVGTNRDSKTFTVFICAVLTVEWSFLSNVQKWVKQSTTHSVPKYLTLIFWVLNITNFTKY